MSEDMVLCCFCNDVVKSTHIDPCDLNVLTNWDKPKNKQKNQTFWCHFACLKDKFHKDVKKHLVLDILSYDDDN